MGHPSSDCPHTRRPGRPGCPCRARGSCRTREPTFPGSGRRPGQCGGRPGRAILEQPVVKTGRIGALGRLLGEATEDQSLEPLADLRSPLPGRCGNLQYVLVCDLYGVAREGLFPDRRVVEGGTERVDVALGGYPLSPQLLWGGVSRRPEVGAGALVARRPVEGAGYAEVRKFGTPPLIEQNVVRLYVAVDNAPLVSMGEPRSDVDPDPQEHLLGEGTMPIHQVLEVATGNVLHDDVGDRASFHLVLASVEDPDYVGVGEPGGGPPLALESQTDLRVLGIRFYDLDGDGTVEYLVTSEEDTGHPARAELAHEHEPVPESAHRAYGTHARD